MENEEGSEVKVLDDEEDDDFPEYANEENKRLNEDVLFLSIS